MRLGRWLGRAPLPTWARHLQAQAHHSPNALLQESAAFAAFKKNMAVVRTAACKAATEGISGQLERSTHGYAPQVAAVNANPRLTYWAGCNEFCDVDPNIFASRYSLQGEASGGVQAAAVVPASLTDPFMVLQGWQPLGCRA